MNGKTTPPLTYRDSGVDIDAGDALVNDISADAARTKRPGANIALGGFGGAFDLKAAGFDDPILVAATDGVGTKLELAQAMNSHRGLGIDLVAMCANDVIVLGAKPLFFLDYFATGKLEKHIAKAVIAGVADGCITAGCALIGGETAEMPGLYPKGKYDLAGFCVGAIERRDRDIIGGAIKPDDVAIAVASSGVHANGFSLVRRVIEAAGADIHAAAPFDDSGRLGDVLLTPTALYTDAVAAALAIGGIKGIAHITGGGLIENPPRAFNDDVALEIDLASWELPPIFRWLKAAGNIEVFEMARVFNCGIGLVIYASPSQAPSIMAAIESAGQKAWAAGRFVPRHDDAVILKNTNHWN